MIHITTSKLLRWLLIIWAFTGIGCLLITPLLYARWDGFLEQGEVTFSAVSWLLSQGHPLYTDLAAAERYSLQHGPVIYLVIGSVMKVLGPSYTTAKMANVAALLLSLVISWLCFSKLTDKKVALYVLGLESWLLLHWPYSYLARPDSLIVLCVVISLYIATTKENKLVLILGTAVPLGIMANLKIHGFAYFLPIMAILWPRLGWRNLQYVGVLALLIGIAPFLLPEISFTNYILWLQASVSHGILWHNIFAKILLLTELGVILVTVGVIYGINLRAFYSRNKRLLTTFLLALIIPVIIGSKAGSGTNHLMPFIPVFIYVMVLLINDIRQTAYLAMPARSTGSIKLSYFLLVLVFLTTTAGGINGERRALKPILSYKNPKMLQELKLIEDRYAGKTLEIGYGEKDVSPLYRDIVPIPVFHGNPYLIDKVALGDMIESGLPVPPATLKRFDEGAVQVWLIPSGRAPFMVAPFDDSLRSAFNRNYVLASKTHFFDIWVHNSVAGMTEAQ